MLQGLISSLVELELTPKSPFYLVIWFDCTLQKTLWQVENSTYLTKFFSFVALKDAS